MSLPISYIGDAAAAVAVAGVIYQIGRWTSRVDANTTATDKLTATFENHATRVDDMLADHGDMLADHRVMLADHEIRITTLQGQIERKK